MSKAVIYSQSFSYPFKPLQNPTFYVKISLSLSVVFIRIQKLLFSLKQLQINTLQNQLANSHPIFDTVGRVRASTTKNHCLTH
jgi:hypothetical protein